MRFDAFDAIGRLCAFPHYIVMGMVMELGLMKSIEGKRYVFVGLFLM